MRLSDMALISAADPNGNGHNANGVMLVVRLKTAFRIARLIC
jgi:hypothetical protein